MAARDLPLRDRLLDRFTATRRALLRRRRLLAVVCVVGAVAAGLRATAPPIAPRTEVVVAAHDLAGGTMLSAADLAVVAFDEDAVPDGVSADPADITGAILAAPLRAGEPVTDVRVVGAGLTDAAPGTVAVPVRLSDAAQAGLLTAGDEIDLLATDPETRATVTVASDVLVLAVPDRDRESTDAITGRLVVLGVPVAEVAAVTGAAVTSFVTYAWTQR